MAFMARLKQSPIIAGITLGILVAAPLASAAETPQASEGAPRQERLISTQGYGEVRVRPDSFRASAGVEAQADTLEKARTEVNTRMQRVTQALNKLRIEGITLQTEMLQIFPVYDQPREGEGLPKIVGYRAQNTLTVMVRGADDQRLGEVAARVVDAAVAAGANNVSGISFFLKDASGARRKALQEAVSDAERNARAIAEIAQVQLSGLVSIDGAPELGGPMLRAFDLAEAAGASSTPIETGETVISSRVTASFAFRLPR